MNRKTFWDKMSHFWGRKNPKFGRVETMNILLCIFIKRVMKQTESACLSLL